MKRAMVLALGMSSVAFLMVQPVSAGSNVLENPSLLDGYETKRGVEPLDWTSRGQMTFSDARMRPKDDAYQFSLTADGDADFPKCSTNQRLHYDGSEAGYFQIYKAVKGGQTWRAKIASKLMTGGRARLFIYAKDGNGKNLTWDATLSGKGLKKWRRLRVTTKLPAKTESVWMVFRGRVCEPGTERFRFRRAVLRQL